ncbi:hypothetical protein BRW64_20630 [Mycolicibacterium diernhoferi]|uniref:Uncharacterized protein n=1 Tax=Mycolicibacterium diernhoferi TaxID=1801 RepID=A0A1Q4H8F6_9MYCO|nr:hypothetical protein BRW64_20630 [Mycolicibacterium diernhoferi]OPE53667.1 hypothetical protein BV510_14345 [Mycolicibacterium diernhoferi]PEG54283.1 hypothetical protein CRI78_11810 [Mycolicibacterium diernhoferi]
MKLLCASAGVGAVLAMTGVSVVQTTTFSADPALPEPTLPSETYSPTSPAPVTTTTTTTAPESADSGE